MVFNIMKGILMIECNLCFSITNNHAITWHKSYNIAYDFVRVGHKLPGSSEHSFLIYLVIVYHGIIWMSRMTHEWRGQ